MSRKLAFKWLGQYQIYYALKRKGTYILEELDRSHLTGTFADDKFKRFHSHQQICPDCTPNLGLKVIPTLEDFLADDSDNNLSDAPASFANF